MSVLLVGLAVLPSSLREAVDQLDPVTPGSVMTLLRRPGTVRALSVSCIVLAAVDISLAYLPVLGNEVRHEVGETSTLVTLVAGGLGAAIVPEPATALRLEGVAHRPLVRPATTIELALARRADRTEPHLTRTAEVVTQLARQR